MLLNELVQLGFHCKALMTWAEAKQASAAAGSAGGASPYEVAVANGFTGARNFMRCRFDRARHRLSTEANGWTPTKEHALQWDTDQLFNISETLTDLRIAVCWDSILSTEMRASLGISHMEIDVEFFCR